MYPHVFAVKSSSFFAATVFCSLAIYLHAGGKEMVVCKVLSRRIPRFSKTNLNAQP